MKGILFVLAMIGMVIAMSLGTVTETKACSTFSSFEGFQSVGYGGGAVFARPVFANRNFLLNRQVFLNRRNLILNRSLVFNRPGVLARAANVLSLARPRVIVVGGGNVGFIRGVSPFGFAGVRGVGCGGLLIR